jgi:hypothetical protein
MRATARTGASAFSQRWRQAPGLGGLSGLSPAVEDRCDRTHRDWKPAAAGTRPGVSVERVRRVPARFRVAGVALAVVAMGTTGCGSDEQGVALLREGGAYVPSAANIPLDTADRRVMLRWVATRSGVAHRVMLRVKVEGAACDPDGREGYADGSSGVLRATTHPVDPTSGMPDERRVLSDDALVPCEAHSREEVDVALGFPVTAGTEYATVIRNADAAPPANWFSLNMLYAHRTAAGPHGLDLRRGDRNWWTGIDSREAIGFDSGDGRFQVPGGPYGQDQGRIFLPTYLIDYGGDWSGQPFYWALPANGMAIGRLAPSDRPRTVSQVVVLLSGAGTGTLEVRAGGRLLGRARVRGHGAARAPLRLTIPAGEEVEVRARVSPRGLSMPILFADPTWSDVSGGAGLPRAVGHRGGALPVRLLSPPPARGR